MSTKSSKSPHFTRREALTITAQKKRESNTKALRIVETLLEENVSEDWLLENVKYIAQSHLQDAIEERSISKACGYPICSRRLGQVPRQQFHISTKTNKVYDITERKHFCSNYCYKAAQYLKVQLLTSPVWLRDNETIPNFHLLPSYSPGEHLGEEVELRHGSMKLENFDVSKDDKTEVLATDSNTFIQYQMVQGNEEAKIEVETDIISTECIQTSDQNIVRNVDPSSIPFQCNEIRIKDEINCAARTENCDTNSTQDSIKRVLSTDKKNTSSCSSDNEINKKVLVNNAIASNETVKKDQKNFKSSHKSKKDVKKTCSPVNFVSRIEASFKAWFTLDSFFYIYGNEKAKELMKDKRDCLKEYYKGVEQSLWEPATQEKYLAICRKLDLMELEESNESAKTESKPLPNIEQLKRDAEIMKLKVREFYGGNAIGDVNNKSISDTEGDLAIPLVELHAQNALRRRIVLDRLRHVLPDLLRTLGMTSRDISGDVRSLITTFALGADNIMFKPAEWNLIGLIILKMLSMKDPKLKTLMETQMAQKYTSMMLMGFQLDGGYMERLMTWLTDIDILLGKNCVNL